MVRWLTMWLMVAGVACGGDEIGDVALEAALDETVDALKRSDFDALWKLADQQSRTELLTLVDDLRVAQALVPKVYAPQSDKAREAALAALGVELVAGIDTAADNAGPTLLSRLISPDRLRFDQHAMDSLLSHDVTMKTDVTPPRAVVTTAAGETFSFIQEEAGWRSYIVRELLHGSKALRELRDNAKKVKRVSGEIDLVWRQVRDAKVPQGAYNLARDAVARTPPNGALLYTLLDDDARKVVLEAMERAREIQRGIQRRVTKAERPRLYRSRGISRFVRATSDRDLYERWAKEADFVPPVVATDDPVSVDGDPATGKVSVTTVSGAKVALARDDSGVWRISGHASALRNALLAPITPNEEPGTDAPKP